MAKLGVRRQPKSPLAPLTKSKKHGKVPKHHRNDGKRSKADLREIKHLVKELDLQGKELVHSRHEHHPERAKRPTQLGRPTTAHATTSYKLRSGNSSGEVL